MAWWVPSTPSTSRQGSDTPAVPQARNYKADSVVVEMTMSQEFDTEEDTKPEITESLEQTLARLTARTATRERPSVRMKAISKPPENV